MTPRRDLLQNPLRCYKVRLVGDSWRILAKKGTDRVCSRELGLLRPPPWRLSFYPTWLARFPYACSSLSFSILVLRFVSCPSLKPSENASVSVCVCHSLSLPLPQSLSVHARIFRGLSRGSISVYLYRLFVARPRSHLSMITWLTKSFRCFCQTFSDCMWPFRPSNPVGHCVFLFLWFLRRTPTESNPVFVAAFRVKFRSWRACKKPHPTTKEETQPQINDGLACFSQWMFC